MAKHITFEQAKWLKGVEFDVPVKKYYMGSGKDYSWEEETNGNNPSFTKEIYSMPEQHQVVDWLLEKYGIWIYVTRDGGWWIPVIQDLSNEKKEGAINIDMNNVDVCFNSPTEAYEAAFDYIKDKGLI